MNRARRSRSEPRRLGVGARTVGLPQTLPHTHYGRAMNSPIIGAKIFRMRLVASVVLVASALVAPIAASGQDEEVTVGAFVLLRSVDFMTDSVSYEWAYSGDPVPRFGTTQELFWDAVKDEGGRPGYNTLDLGCRNGSLVVRLHYEPPRPKRGEVIGFRRVSASGKDLSPPKPTPPPGPQHVPVQLRFDSETPLPPSDWIADGGHSVTMPASLLDQFLTSARPAGFGRESVPPGQSALRERLCVTLKS